MKINKRIVARFAITLLVIANIFVFARHSALDNIFRKPGLLTVAFLNVGQGDAIFIETPSGKQVLIDGGPDKSVLRELGKVMPFWDRSLDLVLESHPDSDHIGGLPDVLERFSVKYLISTGNLSDSKLSASLDNIAKEKHDNTLQVIAGKRIILEPNVYLDILSPIGDPSNWESNKSSMVVKLTYASTSFLFTGDVDESVEQYLVKKYGVYLASDVLKVSHHGSRNSNNVAFINAVSPTYSVISVGAKNKFGHPHKEVLDSLVKLKSKILRTDQLGTIIFKGDGGKLVQTN
jgi:competence protein ComEC